MTMGKIAPGGSLPPHEMRTVLSRHHLTQLLYARIQSHHSDAIQARRRLALRKADESICCNDLCMHDTSGCACVCLCDAMLRSHVALICYGTALAWILLGDLLL